MSVSLPKLHIPNPFKRARPVKNPQQAREELKKKFISEAHKIKAGINDAVLHERAHQFFKLVRQSFEKLFSINYECTFEELKKELESRRIPKNLKTQIHVFLKELEIFEYDFPASEDVWNRKSAKERSEIMSYLNELKAEGRKIDKQIEKDLENVFKDEMSDSTLLLVKYIDEFEELLKKV